MPTEGQNWYKEYLRSALWFENTAKAWQKMKHKRCNICHASFVQFDWHHLRYNNIATKKDYKSIRLVCGGKWKCHYKCHHVFFFIKIPTKPDYLITRYYYLRFIYALKRLILSYRVG